MDLCYDRTVVHVFLIEDRQLVLFKIHLCRYAFNIVHGLLYSDLTVLTVHTAEGEGLVVFDLGESFLFTKSTYDDLKNRGKSWVLFLVIALFFLLTYRLRYPT